MTTTIKTIDISEMSESKIMDVLEKMQPVEPVANDYRHLALLHVRQFHPTCVKVLFDNMGRWRYMDADNNAFDFTGYAMNQDLLEIASDTLDELPVLFELLD